MPQALGGLAGGGGLSGFDQPFDQCRKAVVPQAGRRRAGEHAHALGHAAQPVLLFDQPHAFSRCVRVARGGDARHAATDHQHIAKGGAVLVCVRVGFGRCLAHARCATDEFFVEHPARWRAEEGLVIETCRQERCRKAVDRAQIEAEVWPAVLADRDQAVIDIQVGGAGVRLGPPTFAHGDERIGFLDACRHHPARAMIFEAAGDPAHAVRQQRRRECIAGARAVLHTVEAEAQRRLRAAGDARWAAHGAYATTDRIAWLTRSRRSSNH